MRIPRRAPLVLVPALAALCLAPLAPQAVADPAVPSESAPSESAPRAVTRLATDEGTGGAVTSVDPEATRIGLKVLEQGGNAVDAAVATAAALGVTEPFSAGIGGGGYLVRLDGRTGKVLTIDGRETAPLTSPKRTMFLDPATGDPYPFEELVTSGLSVGTPGTVATWEEALDRWGSRSLRSLLRPAAELARDGFEVDQTFADQVEANAERFAQIRSTAALFLPDGEVPAVGSTFRNPGLGKTYDKLGRQGGKLFYRGSVARNIVRTVKAPPVLEGDLPVPPGHLRGKDLKTYDVRVRKPITLDYRGFKVHGMGSSSSGGSTVGQALAILERLPLSSWTDDRVQHAVLEAGALAFADRNAHVGDRDFVKVPDEALLDKEYADERLCAVSMAQATPKPLDAGDVRRYDGRCEPGAEREGTAVEAEDHENTETTHLVVTDRWGTVVSYTLTIEQTGGAGIVVPGRGFLLNNELTDFSLTWKRRDPNRVEPGKRPRSSMAPTIVTEKGKPLVALGSPGGSTIITTVLGLLVDFIDRGETLEDAIAAPRATQRNTVWVDAEPAWLEAWRGDLEPFGHLLRETTLPGGEIGAATGIEFLRGKQVIAVAEPVRRGGGDARVVDRR